MFLVYFGIYTFFLIIIWSFFVIAKLHSDKFRSFSTHIGKVTKALFFFLFLLSILGYFLLFYMKDQTSFVIKIGNSNNTVQENYY